MSVNEKQPPPKPGGLPVVAMVLEDVNLFVYTDIGASKAWEALKTDIDERRTLGIERYGTELCTHNDRNPVVDAAQEALDLAIYLKQSIAEARWRSPEDHPRLWEAYYFALKTARDLCAMVRAR